MTAAPKQDARTLDTPAEAAGDYWRHRLRSFTSPTPLLDDRAPAQSFDATRFGVIDVPLGEDLSRALSAAIESVRVATTTFLEAAWALASSHHSREGHVLFASLTEDPSPRFVLCPLVVPDEESVLEWLRTLETDRRERTDRAPADPEELRGHTAVSEGVPLFEAVVGVAAAARGLETLRAAALGVELDLHHGVLRCHFAEERLESSSAERIGRHVRTAIEQLATRLEDRVADLSLVGADDLARMDELNATLDEYAPACLHELFEEQVTRTPDAVALRMEGQSLTYAELNRRANRVAHVLRDHGVGPETLVGICVERSFEMLIGLLGILKAGGAYVPLDPDYPIERLEFMLQDADAPVVLVQRHTASVLPPSAARRLVLDDPSVFAEAAESNPRSGVQPANLAYVIFTSGSTGRPKGALNEHRQVVNALSWMQRHYRLAPDDKFLQKTPYSFDASVCELYWPLIAGAQIVIARPGGHKNAEYLVETIQKEGITIIDFVPSMLRVFLADPRAKDCKTLRHVTCGGEALTPELKEQFLSTFDAGLHNLYGPTETAVQVTYWDAEPGSRRVPIGRPVANNQVYILDERMRPLPIGVPGELYIGGAQVGRGYLNRPEQTRERFLPDPFSKIPGGRLYKTGDLARIAPDGLIEYLGRVDFQVKLRGFRVELGEIENALLEHPSVSHAAVLLREDRKDDRRLVGYVVTADGSEPSAQDLRNWLGRSLPEYMVPSAFVFLDRMPINPSGKLDRKALPVPSRERPDTGSPPVPPNTERERLFCGVFAEVLGFDPIGAEDNFFALGGNSLLSMRVLALARERVGVDIPVARFFQHPTPRELDRFVERQQDPAAARGRIASRALKTDHDDVAVIGMAGRFPGARDVPELWKLILEGRAALRKFSEQELDPSLPAELVGDPNYVRARGMIEDFDLFDAGFFGVSPKEARLLDPQQRLLLETAWQALENAGYVPESVPGLVGVYAGVYGNSYLTYHLLSRPEFQGPLDDLSLLLQNEKDYVATRIAHKLNLLGPAVSVHTACSTSLVAVVEAFWSLRTGQCDLAVAGAASLTCPPRSGYLHQEGAMFSADGFTRSFDANASGTTFNDGVAMVVLKRLSDAVADGDTIYGVIRGAATNNDGGKKASFTAPSVEGQAAVIRMAQEVAGVDPRTIGYIEAHGTATPIGDPIEVEALTEAFRTTTADRGFCALSSVKSNIGHLVSAAGTAGLIKTVLSLREGVIAPTAHFKEPNPNIDFQSSPFFVPDRLMEWPRGEHPRRAGVSSFGVGGTNAHVLVEEPPETKTDPSPRPCEVLLLSARSRDALQSAAQDLSEHFGASPHIVLADAAYTLAVGRRGFAERRFVVARDVAEAREALGQSGGTFTRTFDGRPPFVAFLMPGQGAQAPNMGRGLYEKDPVFRTVVDECAQHLQPELGRDLRELLYPADSATAEAADALRNTSITQPALFVTEYATAQVLMGWGVRPNAMVGHSIGEFVCAVLAGVFSLEDALSLVAARGRLMQGMEPGSMLSVRLPAAEVAPRLGPELAIASDNGPALCAVAGPEDAVLALQRQLEGEGVVCRPLLTSHAFHSPMMERAVEPFAKVVRGILLSAPKIPFVSTLTGDWIRDEQAQDPMYWARHLRETVRFREAAARLLERERVVLVEAGPRATLTTLARQQQQAKDRARLVAVPTLGDSASEEAEWRSVLGALGHLWTAGVPVEWPNLYADERRRRIPLPTYPFERKRFWMDPVRRTEAAGAESLQGPLSMSSPILPGAPTAAPQQPFVAAQTAAPLAVESEPTGTMTMTEPAPIQAPPRKPRIIQQLREVFEDISGFEMDDVDEHATFLELGLDSLSLTQVAQQLQKTFKVKITFRELMEAYPNLERLGDHMDKQLPPDPAPVQPPAAPAVPTQQPAAAAPSAQAPQQQAFAPPAMAAAPMFAAAPRPTNGPPGDFNRIVDLLQQQLAVLAGWGGAMPQPQPQAMASAPSAQPAMAAPAPSPEPAVAPQDPLPAVEPEPGSVAAPPASWRRPPASPESNGASQDTSFEAEANAHRKYDVKKAFGAIARINTAGGDDLTPQQRTKLEAFMRRYIKRTERSKEYTQEHRAVLSDPRAVTGFRPAMKELVYQIVIERSRGSHMWDLDGNEYVDVLSGFGCNLFGWQPDFVNKAVIEQIEKGHEIGPMTPLAAEVAHLICEMTGNDRAAFCNTGSEAVMGCMRIARTITGRDTIVTFNGSYHGIFDEVIVRGTKKLRAVPAAPGILPSTAQNVLVLEYGEPESLEIIRSRGSELAAIMVEPVQSRRPDLQPRQFLHDLRSIADECGAVYIFDEVITGFRSHPGGAQAYFGVKADLASYGKVIGGGYPFAVISGKREYMDALDGGYWQYGDASVPTVGVTYFAGTFCRHPLALAAAKASLLHLKAEGPKLQQTLNAKTAALAAELNAHFEAVGAPLEIRHFASLWKVFWKEEQPYGDLLFYYMRDKGIHILDLFPCFLTTAHSDQDIRAIIDAFKESIAELQVCGFLPGRSIPEEVPLDPAAPPVPGARLGRDKSGNPAWYIPNPDNPSKYIKVDGDAR